ncbi:MAG: hypothetical protein ACJ74W_02450 [Pyrinomonadaceae bacterium]
MLSDMTGRITLALALFVALAGCGGAAQSVEQTSRSSAPPAQAARPTAAARNDVPVIHVFVALCDNVNQGIVPVAPSLGNGDDLARNLYWGAAFGVKTFFSRSKDWQLIAAWPTPQPAILERCVFKHRRRDVYLVADAYRGREIKQTINDFLAAASGAAGEAIQVEVNRQPVNFHIGGSASLLAYVGHDGLMDFQLSPLPHQQDDQPRAAIILACASKNFFARPLQATGATPLLWTTNLMAPESYVLAAALDGWLQQETGTQIRQRAAVAYDKYQHCGLKSANALFATGW